LSNVAFHDRHRELVDSHGARAVAMSGLSNLDEAWAFSSRRP
jgi:hypothetical protein